MEFCEIKSKDNPKIKRIVKLQSSSKARKEEGFFVIEGLRTLLDALENKIEFEQFFVSESAIKKHADSIEKFALNSKENFLINESLCKVLSETTTPQGLFAVVSFSFREKTFVSDGKYLGLENVQDPANIGAVFRTAEALGISGIIMTEDCCDPFSPKSLRASMGTALRLPVFFCKDLISFAKENSLTTFSCVIDDMAQPINNVSFNMPCMSIIGNEANGIKEETVKNSDKKIIIPMKGSAQSLNAAVAASIVMWEMSK